MVPLPFKGEAKIVMNGGPPFKGEAKIVMNGGPPLKGRQKLLYPLYIALFKCFIGLDNAAHNFMAHHIMLAKLNHTNSRHIT